MNLHRLHKAIFPTLKLLRYQRDRSFHILRAPGRADDPLSPEDAIKACLNWTLRAQSEAPNGGGGLARDFSFAKGWAREYPETSGYMVPTLLDQAKRLNDEKLNSSAQTMLDWLSSIQFEDGSFQGGLINAMPKRPTTFNTGQILIGIAAGAAAQNMPLQAQYFGAMRRAADWLVATQDEDGAWRHHPSPFTSSGEKLYETHVAIGLLKAGGVNGHQIWTQAGLKNIDYAISQQYENGWMPDCCLTDPKAPLTHTLGNCLRGILEGYAVSRDPKHLHAALKLAEGLYLNLSDDGFLAGRFKADWTAAASWSCLTGSAQIAECWLLLFGITKDNKWQLAAERTLGFIRSTITVDADPNLNGAISGSWPIDGGYLPYRYINWAVKFFIDAQQLALDIAAQKAEPEETPNFGKALRCAS